MEDAINLTEKYEKCLWKKNGFCMVVGKCFSDCDFMKIPYEREAIEERIDVEVEFLKKNKFNRKLKKELSDKLYGVQVMHQALIKIKRCYH
jgi:hypothetical protein